MVHYGKCCVISGNCRACWLPSPCPADNKLSYSQASQNHRGQTEPVALGGSDWEGESSRLHRCKHHTGIANSVKKHYAVTST